MLGLESFDREMGKDDGRRRVKFSLYCVRLDAPFGPASRTSQDPHASPSLRDLSFHIGRSGGVGDEKSS